ncbi:efflux RND transporter periplasmic adaptor subunit [Microbaculum sp. FT89]|uniref:efflux RND transporter periplasmic adaptor subunit n=1 Tax=Microbaculum sp. FT89 TaxID=3447298 RepID=UPI003F52A6ED
MKPPDRHLGLKPAWTLGRVAGLAVKAAVPLALLAAAFAGFEYLTSSRPEVPQRPAAERAWTVETLAAEPTAHRPRITAYGTIVAGRQVALRALVAGEVVSVGDGLREGGSVHAGDPLVEIDSFNYRGAVVEATANLDEARAKLDEAQARLGLETMALGRAREQLEIAERDLERAQTLSQKGSMSQQALDSRRMTVLQNRGVVESGQATLEIQKAQIQQLKAQIERLEWKLRQSERNLADVTLKAPFDAYVGTVAAEVGKLLNVNDVVAVLYDRNRFDVRFALTDSQYGRLLEEGLLDRAVEVRWYVGGAPQLYKARIVRVAPEIAAQRGGVDVYARIEPAQGQAPLRPGAFVEILLDDRVYENVVSVPATAVYGTDRVYVIENGRLAGRTVEIVGYDDADVLIRGAIAGGDKIVVTRITEAGDGLKVNERGAGAPPAPKADASTKPSARNAQTTGSSDG